MKNLNSLVKELYEKFEIKVDLDSNTASYGSLSFDLDLAKAEKLGFKKYILGIDKHLSETDRIKIRKKRYNFAIFAYDSEHDNCEIFEYSERFRFKEKADKILNYSKFYKSDLFEFDLVLDQLVKDPESVDIEKFKIKHNNPFSSLYN